MATQIDFGFAIGQDTVLVINMAPTVNIGGMSFVHQVFKRQGGATPLITKSMSSGFYGVSGMAIQNSGEGILRVSYNAIDASGFDPGNYWHQTKRMDSGSITPAVEGFILLRG